MSRRIKLLVLITIMLSAVPVVQAYGSYTTDELNDSSTEHNFTAFVAPLSELVYLNLPRRLNLTNAPWDITGSNISEWTYTGYAPITSTLTITDATACESMERIWTVQYTNGFAYELFMNWTPTGNSYNLTALVPQDYDIAEDFGPAGITTDCTNIWVVDYDHTNAVYKFEMNWTYTGENWTTTNCTGFGSSNVAPGDMATNGSVILVTSFWAASWQIICVHDMNGDFLEYNNTDYFVDGLAGIEMDDEQIVVIDDWDATGRRHAWMLDYDFVAQRNVTLPGANADATGLIMNDTYYTVADWLDVRAYHYYVGIDYPTNVTIDIGDDGILEYANMTQFTGSATIENSSAIHNYLREICTADWATGTCDVPINYSFVTTGILQKTDINLTGEYLYARYNVSLLIEDDWAVGFDMATANVTILVFCDDSSQLFYNMTDNYYDGLDVFCQMGAIGARVDYDTGDSYLREILTPGTDWNVTVPIYLVDATVFTVLTVPIYMNDPNYLAATLELFKTEGDNHYTIASGYFDVEDKLLTFLKQNARYYLRLELDSETRDISYLYAASATAQYLSLSQITLRPSILLISDNLQMTAAFLTPSSPNSTLRIRYEDYMNLTTDVRVMAFQGINNTPFFNQSYAGSSNLTISLNNVNTSFRYTVFFIVNHARLANSPVNYPVGVPCGTCPTVDLGLPASLLWLYPVIGFVIMCMTAWIMTPENRLPVFVLLLIELAVFSIVGWFIFQAATIVYFIVFLIAGIIYELRYRGVT